MVPLSRRRGSRRGLRPGGAAAETEPLRDLVSAAARTTTPAARHAAPAPPTEPARPTGAPAPAPGAPEGPARPPAAPPTPEAGSGPPGPAAAVVTPPPEVVESGRPAGRGVVVRSAGDADLEWAATAAAFEGLRERTRRWRRRWTWARTLRLTAVMTSCAVLLVCGLAWGATSWFESAVRKIGALDPTSSDIIDPAAQAGDQNYLIVGSDTRVGATPTEDVGSSSDVPGARSDTVMIVHVPADRSRVTAVSFPRDLEIDRPACDRWDSVTGAYTGQQMPATAQVKLNSAYQVGGPRCVTKVIQELSGIAVNHFLGVDFSGFKDMVDAVDGVTLCVANPIRDTVLGTVIGQAGTVRLTGDQALNFVRARHVIGDPTSDYGRIHRQQLFLGALLRETLSAGTLLDLGKLRSLVDAVSRSTYGENIAGDQLLSLGQSLSGISAGDVAFTTVPTTGEANARGNEVRRPVEDRALFDAIIADRPLPGQPGSAPAGAAPVAPVPAEQVALRLVDDRSTSSSDAGADGSDGSGTGDSERTASAAAGDAGSGTGSDGTDASGFRRAAPADRAAQATPGTDEVAGALRGYGFTVDEDGSGSTDTGAGDDPARTTIRFSPDQAGAAATLQKAVPDAVLDPQPGGSGGLVLRLGDDFDGRVQNPAAPAAPAPLPAVVSAADSACG